MKRFAITFALISGVASASFAASEAEPATMPATQSAADGRQATYEAAMAAMELEPEVVLARSKLQQASLARIAAKDSGDSAAIARAGAEYFSAKRQLNDTKEAVAAREPYKTAVEEFREYQLERAREIKQRIASDNADPNHDGQPPEIIEYDPTAMPRSYIDEAKREGIVYQVDYEKRSMRVSVAIWRPLELDRKKEVVEQFAKACGGMEKVTVLSNRDDTLIATHDPSTGDSQINW